MPYKRVSVNLSPQMFEIIEKQLKGKIGASASDVIRTIITIYLTERGYLRS